MTDTHPLTSELKTDFSAIYNQPDPRAYYRTLSDLDYQIPQRALPVVERVVEASCVDGRPRTLLDVCCSYGINAALLRYRVDLDGIASHYSDVEDADVEDADAAFFAGRPKRPDLRVVGLDAAPNAIGYAKRARLLSEGWAEDLETDDPSPALADGVRDVGLIVCTGGVGYIGRRTYARLLDLVDDAADLWLVTFVLRVFGFDEIARTLGEHGLVTEQVPGVTFAQRRFGGAAEQQAAIRDVVDRGLDPAGKEADGWFHADCFVTRPAAAAAREPVAELLAGVA